MAKQIFNRSVTIDGIDIFYREAGDRKNPTLLLLHGFPSSSIMFKNLMVALSDQFYLVAPDYPAFGFSAFPDKKDFEYTFKNIAAYINRFTEELNLQSFSIYLHDYGCPIGLRIAMNNPEKIEKLIVQNGSAYEEGLVPQWDEVREYWAHPTEEKKKKYMAFLSEEGTRAHYYGKLPEELVERVSPELWILNWELLKKPGKIDVHFELNCDYKSNVDLLPEFQKYFRTYQPPTLVIWGKHDVYFNIKETECYKRDLPDVQVHIVNGGHEALETNLDEIQHLIKNFLEQPVEHAETIH